MSCVKRLDTSGIVDGARCDFATSGTHIGLSYEVLLTPRLNIELFVAGSLTFWKSFWVSSSLAFMPVMRWAAMGSHLQVPSMLDIHDGRFTGRYEPAE